MQPRIAVMLFASLIRTMMASAGDQVERIWWAMIMAMVVAVMKSVAMLCRMIVDVSANLTRGKPDQQSNCAQQRHDSPEGAPSEQAAMFDLCGQVPSVRSN